MPRFNELFQSDVKFLGEEVMNVSDIENALSHSYLAQNATNPSNLAKLEKDIVKQGQMWQEPVLVYVDELQSWVLGGGRHRIETAKNISANYAVNASGKLVGLDDDDDTSLELDRIEPDVRVLKFQVKDRKALVQFLQTHNGSRSMTTEEKAQGKEYAETMTALESLKSRLGKAIYAAIGTSPLVFDDGENDTKAVTVTKETCRLIAVKLAAAVKTKFKYATPEQIDELAKAYADYLKENSEGFSSAFAREGYKESVEQFSIVEYDGVLLDDNAEEVEDATWLQAFASRIKTPAKKGAKSKASELSDKLEKLANLLAQQGVDVSGILNS